MNLKAKRKVNEAKTKNVGSAVGEPFADLETAADLDVQVQTPLSAAPLT